MNTNDNTISKLDTQNNDEAIAEVSATEANAVAGGAPAEVVPPFQVPLTKPAPANPYGAR